MSDSSGFASPLYSSILNAALLQVALFCCLTTPPPTYVNTKLPPKSFKAFDLLREKIQLLQEPFRH